MTTMPSPSASERDDAGAGRGPERDSALAYEIAPDPTLDPDEDEEVTDAETHASMAAELRDVSPQERGVLVGVQLGDGEDGWSLEASMDELAALAATAGVDVVGRAAQRLRRPVPATLIGSGKVDEVKRAAADLGAEVVLFDRELNPRQQRNLERSLDIKVLDRTAVILDVFAQHARTREGMLQVELAQNEYRLPRLTRLWTHLARQAGGRAGGAGGGVGLRGPGETQIEIDRRLIGQRISVLKGQLDKLRTQRRQGRKARRRAGLPVVALVGYTNAGKSTLLNAITGTHAYAADQLFATLDPTTRRVELPSGRRALLTDTVGFIQKLPTQLSAAFRATLEEIEEADLLLHVVDVTHPDAVQQAETVERVLDEMGLAEHPMVVAANKIDRVGEGVDPHEGPIEQHPTFMALRDAYPDLVPVSAVRAFGLDPLLAAVDEELGALLRAVRLHVPFNEGRIVSLVHEHGMVDQEDHDAQGTLLSARVPVTLLGLLASYRVDEPPDPTESPTSIEADQAAS